MRKFEKEKENFFDNFLSKIKLNNINIVFKYLLNNYM